MVSAFMAVLNVALILPVTGTAVAPAAGSVLTTVGGGGGTRKVTAAFSLIRGLTRPLRLSVIGTPVAVRELSTSVTVAVGLADLSTAQAPVTWGVAMEVPLKYP